MNTEILLKVLQLDSIFHFLDWQDRIRIHLYMLGRFQSTTPLIMHAYNWIVTNNWSPPKMQYGQDRLLYFEVDIDQLEPIENYTCENLQTLIIK